MSVDKFSDLDNQAQKIVAIDLDGTLAHYDGWKGAEHIGTPVTDAVMICNLLHRAGVKVIVYTCRTNKTMNRISGIDTGRMVRDIGAWLHEWGLGYIHVNEDEGKPFAHAYIGDRQLYFEKNGLTANAMIGLLSQLEGLLEMTL